MCVLFVFVLNCKLNTKKKSWTLSRRRMRVFFVLFVVVSIASISRCGACLVRLLLRSGGGPKTDLDVGGCVTRPSGCLSWLAGCFRHASGLQSPLRFQLSLYLQTKTSRRDRQRQERPYTNHPRPVCVFASAVPTERCHVGEGGHCLEQSVRRLCRPPRVALTNVSVIYCNFWAA